MRLLTTASTLLFLTLAGHGLACQPSKAAFYDDFSKPDAGWGEPRPYRAFVARSMRLKPQPGFSNYWINKTHALQNASLCASFKHPKLKTPAKSYFGMSFWNEDENNYSAVEIDGTGIVSVWRLTDKKWVKVADEVVAASYNKTPGAKNELVIDLLTDTGTVSVNGAKVLEFKDQSHKDNWYAGPWAGNDTDETYEIVFNNVSMAKLP